MSSNMYDDLIMAETELGSYWPMKSGGLPYDRKAAVAQATLTGSNVLYSQPALLTQAVSDGTDKSVHHSGPTAGNRSAFVIGDIYDFPNTDPFAVECWVKPDAAGTAEYIMGKRGAGAGGWRLYRYSDNRLAFTRFDAAGSSDEVLIAAANFPSGVVHHIVGIYDGTNMYVLLDGLLYGPVASSRLLPGNGQALQLGGNGSDSNNSFGGYMSNVAIYTAAIAMSKLLEHRRVGVGAERYDEALTRSTLTLSGVLGGDSTLGGQIKVGQAGYALDLASLRLSGGVVRTTDPATKEILTDLGIVTVS